MDEKQSNAAVRDEPALERPVGRRYETPVLVVYGSIREITLQNGPNLNKDGGKNGLGERT